jgi:hypothetical protein
MGIPRQAVSLTGRFSDGIQRGHRSSQMDSQWQYRLLRRHEEILGQGQQRLKPP